MKDCFLQGSSLVKTAEEIELIREFTGKSYLVSELIYKATKDGFTASAFHTKCDTKGATIVLIKSKNTNQVFGGYNPVAWSSNGSYGTEGGAFLFHVTKKAKLE